MCGVQTAMAMTSTFWRYTETPGEIEGYWYDTPAGAKNIRARILEE
jgi:hypothetical protein